MYRRGGFPIPNDGGFALIGDADRGDVGGAADLLNRVAANLERRRPDLLRIMFDPTWLRKVLRQLDLRCCPWVEIEIERDGARRCGALVNGEDELAHGRAQKSRQARRSTLIWSAGALAGMNRRWPARAPALHVVRRPLPLLEALPG